MKPIPTPIELLREFQKIDPSLSMVSIPNLGVISYGSSLHNFGFVVGIEPETGQLKAIVGNANIYVPNQESTYMDLPDLLSWFAENFLIWKEIPVEGRTVSNTEYAATQAQALASDDGDDDMEISPLVLDIIAGRVKNEIILPATVGK